MLAIQSGIAKYHCLYNQGAVAFQTPGFFDSLGILLQWRGQTKISGVVKFKNFQPGGGQKGIPRHFSIANFANF